MQSGSKILMVQENEFKAIWIRSWTYNLLLNNLCFFPTLILYFVCFFRPIGNFFGSLCFVCEKQSISCSFFVTFLHSVFRDTLYIRRPLTLELCVVQTKKKSSSNSFGPKSIFTLWREKTPKRSLDPISIKEEIKNSEFESYLDQN